MCFNPDSASDNEGGWLTGYIDQYFFASKNKKKNLFDFVLERQNGSYYRVLEFDIYLTWIYLV